MLILAALALDAPAQSRATGETAPDGLSPHEWADIRQQYEEHRHTAFPVCGGHLAANPSQQWRTRFDGRGFTIRSDAAAWEWGLELRGYGFPGHERLVAPDARPRHACGGSQRLAYHWDDNLEEWFVNDSRGLEHGFTLDARPPAAPSLDSQSSSLAFLLAVRGGLRPEVQEDGRGVRFMDAHGGTALTYQGLTVFDADGRTLNARFEAMQQPSDGPQSNAIADEVEWFLRLAVAERGARYPLTIDPIAQQAYLKASNTGRQDFFAYSVAVSGATVVIGAPRESSNATGVNGDPNNDDAAWSGAAYVFVRSGSTWSQQAYLKASNAEEDDNFDWSVAISGDTLVVGAWGEASNATGVNGDQSDNSASLFGVAGAAYVFVRSGTTWSQQAHEIYLLFWHSARRRPNHSLSRRRLSAAICQTLVTRVSHLVQQTSITSHR